jgi:hypothetical protein
MGQKRTLEDFQAMSALPPKADIDRGAIHSQLTLVVVSVWPTSRLPRGPNLAHGCQLGGSMALRAISKAILAVAIVYTVLRL